MLRDIAESRSMVADGKSREMTGSEISSLSGLIVFADYRYSVADAVHIIHHDCINVLCCTARIRDLNLNRFSCKACDTGCPIHYSKFIYRSAANQVSGTGTPICP
ncbi:hypothetical protein D3C75_594030 [compost metagenome]